MPSIAAERAAVGRDLLPLRGTLAAPLPPHVRDAVAAALDEHAVTPPSRGHVALREAIARSLPAPADPERELLVTNGAMQALGLMFRALLESGDEVIVPTPCYFFAGLIERAGGVFVPVPSWDPEAIERAVTPRSRVLVLTNPNNPDGYLPSRAEIDELLALASRHDLTVITDEAYERCIHEGELASRVGRAERDPDPQPRQEPRDAGLAHRLRRRRAAADRRHACVSSNGTSSASATSPSEPPRPRSKARRTGSTRSRSAIAATGTPPMPRSPSTRS